MIASIGTAGIPRWASAPLESLPNRGLQTAALLHRDNSEISSPSSLLPVEAISAIPSKYSLPPSKNENSLSKLMEGMLDRLDLSPEAMRQLQISKLEVQVEYQILRSLDPKSGTETFEINFRFEGVIEMAGDSSGEDISPLTESEASSSSQAIWDYFSPEKTAERILDFALGFFPMSRHYKEGGDVEEARKAFADFIGNAIQKGFDEARRMLGPIAQTVEEHIDKTHTLVFDGLKDFVTNGRKNPEGKSALPTLTDLQQYVMELTLSYHQTTRAPYRSVYNEQGKIESLPSNEALDLVA